MSKVINVGLIGCGGIGINHAQNYVDLPESRLVAVYNRTKQKAVDFAKRFGATAYSDLNEMLNNPDLEAVSVCTSHPLHAEHTIAATEAGKHVLCEKPIAATLEQADAMTRAARKAGVKLAIMFQMRFNDLVNRIKTAIKTEELGEIFLTDLIMKTHRTQEYYRSSAWRAKWTTEGGGVLINQGVHSIDILQWLMGEIESVQGWIATKAHDIEVEDTALAKVQFKNGALSIIECSTATYPALPTEICVHGTKGSAIMKGMHASSQNNLSITAFEGRKMEYYLEPLLPVPKPLFPFGNPLAHRPVIKDFLESIIQDREPKVTGEEGRKSLELIRAIYISSKYTKTVDFPFQDNYGLINFMN